MSSRSAPLSTPQGLGSVAAAPNRPPGFTDTFTSRYVATGELRLHAVTGGDGAPLLLVHGWPETAFLAPCRDGSGAAQEPRPHAATASSR